MGDMNITAKTVYLNDGFGIYNIIVGSTNGAINFNSGSSGNFTMKDAMMENIGSVTLSNYVLNLDPSGIKSTISIVLNIFNPDDIVFPDVLIGSGSSITGQASSKNFLDSPSIVINKIIPKKKFFIYL